MSVVCLLSFAAAAMHSLEYVEVGGWLRMGWGGWRVLAVRVSSMLGVMRLHAEMHAVVFCIKTSTPNHIPIRIYCVIRLTYMYVDVWRSIQ